MPGQPWTVALCQANATADLPTNLARTGQLIADAAAAGAKLACLPELFTCLCAAPEPKHAAAQAVPARQAMDFLATAARDHAIHLAGGSMGVQGSNLIRNRSLVHGPDGQLLATYDKIHLFRFRDTDRDYDESVDYEPGTEIVTCTTPLGRLGLSICYDVRFPELYRKMARPDIILVPAAFTRATGQAHWELLLRARAVENQCYVLGTAQCGEHPGGLQTWGHSMIVNPWGEVEAMLGDEPGVLLGQVNPAAITAARQRLPALDNRML